MNNKSKNTFLTYFFLLLSVFVLVLFTKNFYQNVLETSKQKEVLAQTLSEKSSELDKLSKIKSDIDSGNVKDINFDKFLVKFSEDELVEYFYNYAKTNPGKAEINSISLKEWKLNEYWFNEAGVDLSVNFLSEQEMIKMLNFLLNSEKYNLYIHDFTYPLWKTDKPFRVNIPLKVLYK